MRSRELSTLAWAIGPEEDVGVEEADGVPGHDGSVAQGLNLATLALFDRTQQLDIPSCKKPND